MEDFADDAIYVTTNKAVKGKDRIRAIYDSHFRSLDPAATSSIISQTIEGEIVLFEWTADTPAISITDGVDTFVIRNGSIVAQLYAVQQYPKTNRPSCTKTYLPSGSTSTNLPGDHADRLSPRVCQLLLEAFEKWHTKPKWIPFGQMGHLFDRYRGEELQKVMSLSVAERKALCHQTNVPVHRRSCPP